VPSAHRAEQTQAEPLEEGRRLREHPVEEFDGHGVVRVGDQALDRLGGRERRDADRLGLAVGAGGLAFLVAAGLVLQELGEPLQDLLSRRSGWSSRILSPRVGDDVDAALGARCEPGLRHIGQRPADVATEDRGLPLASISVKSSPMMPVVAATASRI
jgi:hypothetical protein